MGRSRNGVGVVGLTGAFAEATVSGNVNANVSSGSTLGSTGAVLVEAELLGPHQATAEAHATAGSLGLIGSLSIMDTQATVSGNLVANLGGNVTSSASITVRAQGANTATADTFVVGIGTFAGAGGGAGAEVSGNTDATTGSGNFVSSGAVLVTATSANTATATSDIGAGGLFAVGVSLPTATVSGRTLAQLNADVDPTAVEINATSANHATATSEVIHIGLFSGAGTKADATVDAGASTQALVGASSSITASGSVHVFATSDNNATVHVPGGGGGLVSVDFMEPTATVAGLTKAHLDGDVNAGSLTVRSTTSNDATADAHVTSITLAASASGIIADAEITSAAGNEASIGSSSTVVVGGAVDVEAIQTGDNAATASASGTGTGLIDAGIFVATAKVGGSVLAEIDGNVTEVVVDRQQPQRQHRERDDDLVRHRRAQLLRRRHSCADHGLRRRERDGRPDVAGKRAGLRDGALGEYRRATSDAASGSLAVRLAVNLPKKASVGRRRWPSSTATRARPTRSLVQATSASNATATANIFSIGLLGSIAAAILDAETTSGASTDAIVGSTSSISEPSAVIQVLATSANTANASAHGRTGTLGRAVAVMIPSAAVGGATTAHFDGDIGSGLSLTVRSRTSNSAIADAEIAAISFLDDFGGGGADGDHQVQATRPRSAPTREHHRLGRQVRCRRRPERAEPLREATIGGDSTGAISGTIMAAEAHVGGSVLAATDGVVAGGSITISANGTNHADARRPPRSDWRAQLLSVSTFAEVTGGVDVSAEAGSTGSLTSAGTISITASSHNSATATSGRRVGRPDRRRLRSACRRRSSTAARWLSWTRTSTRPRSRSAQTSANKARSDREHLLDRWPRIGCGRLLGCGDRLGRHDERPRRLDPNDHRRRHGDQRDRNLGERGDL